MRFCNRIVYVTRCEVQGVKCEAPRQKSTLRSRWPFLDAPDCPMELHAIVGHRISRYNEYTRLYGQLRDCRSVKECGDVSRRLLDAYIDNRQCTQELDYYQQHGKMLGRHPQLRHFQQLSRLRSMNVRDLLKEQQKTRDNIWRVNSEIRKGDKPHLLERRQQKLQEYELKLKEINRLLGE